MYRAYQFFNTIRVFGDKHSNLVRGVFFHPMFDSTDCVEERMGVRPFLYVGGLHIYCSSTDMSLVSFFMNITCYHW